MIAEIQWRLELGDSIVMMSYIKDYIVSLHFLLSLSLVLHLPRSEIGQLGGLWPSRDCFNYFYEYSYDSMFSMFNISVLCFIYPSLGLKITCEFTPAAYPTPYEPLSCVAPPALIRSIPSCVPVPGLRFHTQRISNGCHPMPCPSRFPSQVAPSLCTQFARHGSIPCLAVDQPLRYMY